MHAYSGLYSLKQFLSHYDSNFKYSNVLNMYLIFFNYTRKAWNVQRLNKDFLGVKITPPTILRAEVLSEKDHKVMLYKSLWRNVVNFVFEFVFNVLFS